MTAPELLAAISGYEVPIVVLAVIALVVLAGSALLGVYTRLVRGAVQRPARRWGRSPGRRK